MIIQERYVISSPELVFAFEKCNHNIRDVSLSTPSLWGRARGRGAWGFFSSVCKVNHDLPEKAMFSGTRGHKFCKASCNRLSRRKIGKLMHEKSWSAFHLPL